MIQKTKKRLDTLLNNGKIIYPQEKLNCYYWFLPLINYFLVALLHQVYTFNLQ